MGTGTAGGGKSAFSARTDYPPSFYSYCRLSKPFRAPSLNFIRQEPPMKHAQAAALVVATRVIPHRLMFWLSR